MGGCSNFRVTSASRSSRLPAQCQLACGHGPCRSCAVLLLAKANPGGLACPICRCVAPSTCTLKVAVFETLSRLEASHRRRGSRDVLRGGDIVRVVRVHLTVGQGAPAVMDLGSEYNSRDLDEVFEDVRLTARRTVNAETRTVEVRLDASGTRGAVHVSCRERGRGVVEFQLSHLRRSTRRTTRGVACAT